MPLKKLFPLAVTGTAAVALVICASGQAAAAETIAGVPPEFQ
ncbi:hypothetical protein [Nocardia crassostreae]|nr:hypothetical protein [Nocardia crassostreae]